MEQYASRSVVVHQVCKSYGSVVALKNVSFDVNPGELFGIIGPDGAGKTTLFRILTTLIEADSGSTSVLGHDTVSEMRLIRKEVGYMPGRFSLYQDLSVRENLEFFASVFGVKIEDNYEMIAPIYSQLQRFENRRAGRLSGGMKQKLALCCALVHYPKLLFLDEPTTGVDPVSRKEFWQMLVSLRKKGITIIVSTPYMDEAAMCDRIVLCKDGNFLPADSVDNIKKGFKGTIYSLRGKDRYKLLIAAKDYEETMLCYPFGDSHHIIFKDGKDYCSEFITYMQSKSFDNVLIEVIPPGIEDCFIRWSTGN